MKKISGVGKRHIFKNFFKRINTPYDLRIQNAIDGEEMLHVGLTKKSIYILISSFLVFSFLLTSLLFLFTPIKYYIPGYETNASRKKLVALSAKIEELESYQRSYQGLIRNVSGVITEDEGMLLDTVSLSKSQLSSAEMSNQSKINTALGKKRYLGKKKLDTSSVSNFKVVLKDKKEKVIEKRSAAPAPKPIKKKDTIITYK